MFEHFKCWMRVACMCSARSVSFLTVPSSLTQTIFVGVDEALMYGEGNFCAAMDDEHETWNSDSVQLWSKTVDNRKKLLKPLERSFCYKLSQECEASVRHLSELSSRTFLINYKRSSRDLLSARRKLTFVSSAASFVLTSTWFILYVNWILKFWSFCCRHQPLLKLLDPLPPPTRCTA